MKQINGVPHVEIPLAEYESLLWIMLEYCDVCSEIRPPTGQERDGIVAALKSVKEYYPIHVGNALRALDAK